MHFRTEIVRWSSVLGTEQVRMTGMGKKMKIEINLQTGRDRLKTEVTGQKVVVTNADYMCA